MQLKKDIVFETTFDTYTATGIIGQGGSGIVYAAQDDLGTAYAIKQLNPNGITQEKVRRFKNEVHFCLRKPHKNIVPVTDHGFRKVNDKSCPFYVMPRFHGSLRNLFSKGIPPERALYYFSQMLDGVEASHLKGVVHRDLKPENFLYDAKEDLLVVCDFGIAHFEEEELYTAVETKDNQRLANFVYAAPEQKVRGQEVDCRADVYALGLMLNEMFTGEVPQGSNPKTIAIGTPELAFLDDLVDEMRRQSRDERISSIDLAKQQLNAGQKENIVRQKISAIDQTVVPVAELDDILVVDPPTLVDFDWHSNQLTLILSRGVNEKWIWSFQNMGSHSSLVGKGPEMFSISENKATIGACDRDVQQIIDYFKEWLPQVNGKYVHTLRDEKRKEEESTRKKLQAQRQAEEARLRVLNSVKI